MTGEPTIAVTLSPLPHTWLIDLDGCVLRHNGHLAPEEEILEGVADFWTSLPSGDVIVLLSARGHADLEATLEILRKRGLRYDHALFGLPVGERILINDAKPSGLKTALCVNLPRDDGLGRLRVEVDHGR